jgi:dTDP-4-dehydrorhamnose 3,5-epimerase-like enzyme
LKDLKHSELFQGRARLIPFAARAEPRGNLIPFDFGELPFVPRHAFIVRNVPTGTVRGRHAHKNALQLFVCVAGAVSVELRDVVRSETVVLDRPDTGLLIGEGLWAAQTYLTPDAVVLVFLSEPYDPRAYLDEPRA